MDKYARPAGLRGHFETGMAPSSHRRIEASITRQMEELEAQEHSSDAESAVGKCGAATGLVTDTLSQSVTNVTLKDTESMSE